TTAEILAVFGVDPATAVPSMAAAATAESHVFVGRTQQLAALHRAFAECKKGQVKLVFIEGEPGVGKSALVRHFLADEAAHDPRLVVLAGRCYEQESVPFKGLDTVVDSLSVYLASLDGPDAIGLLLGGVRFLASVFPVLMRVPVVARQVPPDRAVGNP